MLYVFVSSFSLERNRQGILPTVHSLWWESQQVYWWKHPEIYLASLQCWQRRQGICEIQPDARYEKLRLSGKLEWATAARINSSNTSASHLILMWEKWLDSFSVSLYIITANHPVVVTNRGFYWSQLCCLCSQAEPDTSTLWEWELGNSLAYCSISVCVGLWGLPFQLQA